MPGLWTGCAAGRKLPEDKSTLVSESAVKDKASAQEDNIVSVDGEEFKLSYETHHGNMYYKTDIAKLSPNTSGAWCELTHYKDSKPLVSIHLVYYEGKTAEDVMAKSENKLTAKVIGDIEYQYFEYDENGMPGHTYLYTYNGTSYTISFASSADISSLEEMFMKYVHFGE